MAGPAAEGKTSAELNAGNGLWHRPVQVRRMAARQPIVGERNDSYWGEKPAWTTVILRPLSNNTARVAALLSGDVDLIEDPPTTDLAKLKNDPKIHLDRAVSNRVIYIHLDQHGEPPIAIPDTNGKNPLIDKRVREALSIASIARASPTRSWKASRCRRATCCPTRSAARRRTRRSTPTIRPRPRSCWPRRAIPTASRSPWARPTAATSTTSRSPRRSPSMWSRMARQDRGQCNRCGVLQPPPTASATTRPISRAGAPAPASSATR